MVEDFCSVLHLIDFIFNETLQVFTENHFVNKEYWIESFKSKVYFAVDFNTELNNKRKLSYETHEHQKWKTLQTNNNKELSK